MRHPCVLSLIAHRHQGRKTNLKQLESIFLDYLLEENRKARSVRSVMQTEPHSLCSAKVGGHVKDCAVPLLMERDDLCGQRVLAPGIFPAHSRFNRSPNIVACQLEILFNQQISSRRSYRAIQSNAQSRRPDGNGLANRSRLSREDLLRK